MDLLQLPLKELEKKVNDRMKWLRSVIDFVTDVTRKHGKQLEYNQGRFHTYSKHELKDIQDFSFMIEGSFSMMGGEALKIWYAQQEVLHIEWSDIEKIRVQVCIDEEKWAGELNRLMKQKKKLFPAASQKKKREKEKRENEENKRFEDIRRNVLLERALEIKL